MNTAHACAAAALEPNYFAQLEQRREPHLAANTLAHTERYGRLHSPESQLDAHRLALDLRECYQPQGPLELAVMDELVELTLRRASIDQQIATLEYTLAARETSVPRSSPVPVRDRK